MRTCPKCKEPGEFYKNRRSKTGLQGYCKRCSKKATRDWYDANRVQHRTSVASRRRELRQKVLRYLSTHPCVDCGESDVVVLEFDHIKDNKRKAISALVNDGNSEKIIWQEIAKCVVRCANCHRRKTTKQLNYRPLIVYP